jgi:hypothetical protein
LPFVGEHVDVRSLVVADQLDEIVRLQERLLDLDIV